MKSTIILHLLLFLPIVIFGQDSLRKPDQRYHDTVPPRSRNHETQKSQKFYDSVQSKFSRHTFTKLMYNLAFSGPPEVYLSDTLEKLASELPFLKFKGKIIRSVRVYVLAPFGTTILDTTIKTRTGVGRALNDAHINTRKFVILKYILFKPGEAVDPRIFADNERIIRNLPAIDNARIHIVAPHKKRDSVDVFVVAKDVWSIGFDVATLTMTTGLFRLYDANFLGLADRLTISFSINVYRAPFLRLDGVSYIMSNIGGSFIDGYIAFSQNDKKNNKIEAGLQRSFLANKLKWAGGAWGSYNEDVEFPKDSAKIISYYTSENLWLGWAFPIKKRQDATRLVLSGAAYNRNFSSRPPVSIGMNRKYYNNLQLFTGIAVSKNDYYLSNYIQNFGKTENIPYGHLVQLTAGPEFNEFYTRVYTGMNIAGGDFLKKFGYLSTRLSMGGYFYKKSFEDAVVKAQLLYLTYLYKTKAQYKFRLYTLFDYRFGFNLRNNNLDYSNLDQVLQFTRVKNEDSLKGTQSFAVNLYAVMFTPWLFYGFKFALLTQLYGGFVTREPDPLFYNNTFYSGIRIGLMIKNDNLIFPTFIFSLFFYPRTPANIPWFQYSVTNAPNFEIPDFTVTAPHTENLQN